MKGVPKDLIILGSGGQGIETAQIVWDINRIVPTWNLIGFIDDNMKAKPINDLAVIGSVSSLSHSRYNHVCVVCAIGNPQVKKKVLEKIYILNDTIRFATIIHPSAVVSDYSNIGEGSIIAANTVVSVDCHIGRHVLVNYNATIGHGAFIDSYSSVYPGARISGNANVGECVELGANCTILPEIHIGSDAIVGAGAVVNRSLPTSCTAVGVPARPIKGNKKIYEYN